jgi:dipeptidyl aminopeptidase/acylaminoacyl peptidase
MMNRISGKAVAILLGCTTFAGLATAGTPGELFARHVEYADAKISPTGEYVLATTPFEDRRALAIIKLSGKFDRNLIKFDAPETVSNAHWTDNNRVIVEKAKDYGYFGSLASTGNIYGSDADASHQTQLFGYLPDHGNVRSKLKDEGNVSFMGVLPGTDGEALFYYSPWAQGNSQFRSTVFRINTHTGARKQIESIGDDVGFLADNAGVPRFTVTEDLNGNQVVRYRRLPTDTEWATIPALIAGQRLNVWFFEPDNNHLYAEISDHGEAAQVYRISLAEGTRERIAGNPNMEVSSVLRAGHLGKPFAVMYSAGRPKVDYIDPKSEWAQLHGGLMKLFPGQMVYFADFSEDNNKVLFYVYSDRHPGAYYTFDRTSKVPQLLFETMDWIDPAKMAPVAPIEFKNRSGDSLYAFYTAPLGKQGAHPLVVIPHGGPFGISDGWAYDADVQFLASLGYAVLQVNYRGSSERGQAFERSTYQQWGTGIQDDIADGVRHLVSQKLVDAGKVCIYGGSFGGYSALMNPIRNPGMYKCAIGYAGVYDLGKHKATHDSSRQIRSWYDRTIGVAPELIEAQSPARHAANIDIPVLLIHGKSDHTAAIDQFDAAEAALRHAGKTVETLVKQNEGHGFYKVADQTEAYNRMQAFLLKYNPPN